MRRAPSFSSVDIYDTPVWLELFLTPSEKDAFAAWREVVQNKTVVGIISDPIFAWLAKYVPDNVAPNVLSLTGSFAVLQAWYLCELYVDKMPMVVSIVSICSLGLFWILGGVDGKHARRTMNDTSLGELFKYVSDIVGTTFLVMVMCSLLLDDPRDYETQWYCVQTAQMVLLMKHYSAFLRDAGLRYILIGPGELITAWTSGLAFGAVFGTGLFKLLYTISWGFVCDVIADKFGLAKESYIGNMYPARALFIMTFIGCLCRIAASPKAHFKREHIWTRKALCGILVLRAASAFLRIFVMQEIHTTTSRDVVFDGLFLGLVTSDIVVAKMAGRELHTWVVLMAAMVVMPHLQLLILGFLAIYYTAVFADLMNHMNLPLLQKCTNVYCDGVYDMCHIGHKNLFREALKLGNRLFVGVVGDEDASDYKRPPIMSAAEREAEVNSCKGVTKVIKNSPCFGLTEEFIKKHSIHVVAFGLEYQERFPNPDDDPYYKVPRKMGIGHPMPRSEGMSTSDLIKRIQRRDADVKKSPT